MTIQSVGAEVYTSGRDNLIYRKTVPHYKFLSSCYIISTNQEFPACGLGRVHISRFFSESLFTTVYNVASNQKKHVTLSQYILHLSVAFFLLIDSSFGFCVIKQANV